MTRSKVVSVGTAIAALAFSGSAFAKSETPPTPKPSVEGTGELTAASAVTTTSSSEPSAGPTTAASAIGAPAAPKPPMEGVDGLSVASSSSTSTGSAGVTAPPVEEEESPLPSSAVTTSTPLGAASRADEPASDTDSSDTPTK